MVVLKKKNKEMKVIFFTDINVKEKIKTKLRPQRPPTTKKCL